MGCFVLVIIAALAIAMELFVCFVEYQRFGKSPLCLIQYQEGLRAKLGKLKAGPIGIWEKDDVLGYRHKPTTTGEHIHKNFHATYSTGEYGQRLADAPDDPNGRILFLGGSFTFGYGVNDTEPFPAVLGSGVWKDWEVINRAVSGWGTVHALLTLEEELAAGRIPDLVIYSMIPHHLHRNYLRKSWMENIWAEGRAHPKVVVENGRPVHQGLAKPGDGLEETSDLEQAEDELFWAVLKRMQKLCKDSGCPLKVALLPPSTDWQRYSPTFVKTLLDQEGLEMLDLSSLDLPFILSDPHPTAEGHVILAEAFDQSSAGEFVRERAAK